MSGLEKITDSIISEAKASASDIIKEAQAKADAVIDAAEKNANTLVEQGKEEDEKQYKLYIQSSKSAGELLKKQKMLETKRMLIDKVISVAKGKLSSLKGDEYFNTLYKLSEKYSHKDEDGLILVNERDYKVLPKDFEKKMSTKGNLRLGEKRADIADGFILVYGGIEENCSFDAIIDAKRDRIADSISATLFVGR